MTEPPDSLDRTQLAAVRSREPRVVVSGPAGSGRTTVLIERFASLVESGTRPERILVLERDEADADRLRTMLEDRLDNPWEELAVLGADAMAARVLRMRDRDPAARPELPMLGPADRLALLADSLDRLTLDSHDLGRDPLVLLRSLIERIDLIELSLVPREAFTEWAKSLPDGEERRQELEFASVWEVHDSLLGRAGSPSGPRAIREAVAALEADRSLRAEAAGSFDSILADGIEDLEPGHWRLVELLASEAADVTVFTDPQQGCLRADGDWTANLRRFEDSAERVDRFQLGHRWRVAGETEFWQATTERAQAQAVAADIERLVLREGVAPGRIAVIVGSVTREGPAIEVALEERALPNHVEGAQAFLQRAEIRDLLAWLRLLNDPTDGAAVIRALARPPTGLGSADIARCSTIARRRRLDLVSALAAATESPQVPPESRDRIRYFLRLHSLAARALDELRPDLFIHRLIERLGLRSSLAYSASPLAAERLRALATFGELAAAHVRRDPQATARDFARHITSIARSGLDDLGIPMAHARADMVEVVAMDAVRDREWDHVFVVGLDAASLPEPGSPRRNPLPAGLRAGSADGEPKGDDSVAHVFGRAASRARTRLVLCHARSGRRGEALHPSPLVEAMRESVGGEWAERETELFAPGESLKATYRAMRDELLETVERTGRHLLELRLDTGEDVDRATVRFLELLKLAAINDRPEGHAVQESLAAINEKLRAVATDSQRELLADSALDSWVTEADRGEQDRSVALNRRVEPSLEAFIPKRGDGLALSAGDIETYRMCPLRYKFARVMRVPQDPTTAQRFGIVVHQVLERWHRSDGGTEAELLNLLEQSWRRSGLGDGERERQLKGKARDALIRHHARESERDAEAVWIERGFSFRIGPHLLRGRVDRVDRHADGGFELIDYKTSFPKTAEQLRDDVQLTLYAIAAQEAWMLDPVRRSYWYVLDDDRVEVPGEIDRDEIEATVHEVAEGILGQEFEPTPSFGACSICDWRLACPAAESN